MKDQKRSSSGFKGDNKTQHIHSGGFKYSNTPHKTIINIEQVSPPVSNIYNRLGVSQRVEESIDRMKQQRRNLFEKEINKGFDYSMGDNILKIYDGAGRKQEAMHIPSSLLQPTLQNVQAQLQAHRIALKPLQQKYFQMKGLIPPSQRPSSNPKPIGLSIQQQTKDVIYKLKKNQIGAKSKRQLQQQQLQRMFQQKKKIDPKLAQYDRKFRQYKLQKMAVQKSSKSNKSPQKTKDKQMLELYDKQKQQEEQIKGIQQKYDTSKILATNNDKFICKYIFKQLDKEKKQIVSKQQLYDFMLANQLLMANFKIDKKWFYSDLEMFEGKRKGLMNVEEVTKFLVDNKMKQHPQMELIDLSISNKRSNCLLGSGQLSRIQQLFKSIDLHQDNIVSRQELIAVIFNDEYMIRRLNDPAIRISAINKTVSLRQVLDLILRQYRSIQDQSKKKTKQFITLKQLLDYFEDINTSGLQQPMKQSQQFVIFDIDEENLQLVKDIYDGIPRVYQNYIVIMDFIQACKRDPQFKLIANDICRIQSIETGLPVQTIRAVLNRLPLETDEYQCWDSIKPFFSRRGRPLNWTFEKVKLKKQLRQKQRKEQFDKMLKSLNVQQKKQYLQSLALGKTIDKNAAYNKVYKDSFNYTLPQPFNIADQRKKPQQKIHCQGMIDGQKEFDQLKAGIKSLPLNKEMLQPKLEQMQQARRKRRQRNKQKSRNKLLNTQDPFSFHQRDLIAKVLKEAAILSQDTKNDDNNSIKPIEPPSNLKKKYKDIMDQQQKKRDQQRKKRDQNRKNPEVNKRLYPDDPANLKKQKNKKVAQKMQKIAQAQKRKKQQLQKEKNALIEKNKQKQRKHQQQKQLQKQAQKQRNKITDMNENMTKKPKINQYVIKGDIQQGKKRREEEQRKRIQQIVKRKQQQRNKRLKYQPKQQQKLNIENMDQQDILDNLSDISLSDLLEEEEKLIWKKRRDFEKIPFSNKYKMNKDRQKALMLKQRKLMQDQQKARRQQIKNSIQSRINSTKQKTEKNITNQLQRNKDKSLNINGKDFNSKFNFNKSKALRRYYELMDGNPKPSSQYDRMSHEARTVVCQQDIQRAIQQQQREEQQIQNQ